MLVHPKRRERYQVNIPLTSLIDVVFLLLVYFLLTTNFMVEEGIRVKLPNAKASSPQKEKSITIYLKKNGEIYLSNKQISINDLFNKLQEMLNEDKNKLVVIKADYRIILNKLVRVMDVVKAAGARKLCLATEKGLH